MEEVQTNEEAQEIVHDLGLFVTVQLLEDTPAVLPLGPNRTRIFFCKTNNFEPLVVPWLLSSSGTSSSSTSTLQDSSSSDPA